jgi:hypothetical protein
MRISMSLVAAPRANNLSQLNTVTEIKYSSRNSTVRDHSMIPVRVETPVHGPARSFGTVQVTVHRIDAQAAAGTDSVVDADFAADGVDEVLTWMIQRRIDAWAVAELSGTVVYHAADAGRAWTVRLVAGQLPQTAAEAVTEPDASVVGLADAVYPAAWGRPSGAAVSGDVALVDATRAG